MESDEPAGTPDAAPPNGDEEERRRRREETGSGWCDCDWPWGFGAGSGTDAGNCDWNCDGCGGCDLLRVSVLLVGVAVLAPRRRGMRTVLALVRGYRRWLTRYTPRCPSTPSCSAYAVAAVERLGPRHGLHAAARRVRACGSGAVGPVRHAR